MRSNHIVYTNDNKIHAFYHVRGPGSGIHCRIFEGNKWQKPFLLASGAREGCNVTISKNGDLYVFTQEHSGDIKLYVNRQNTNVYTEEMLVKNQSPVVNTVCFNSLITDTGMFLIYNSPVQEDKTQFLVTQRIDGNGAWTSPSRIDKITNLPGTIFDKQNISDNHCIVFYTTKTPDTNIGYREFTSNKSGGFHLIHSTGYTLYDYSFLVTDDTVHALFLLKSMFSTQLVYRKKTDTGYSSPIIIWEGQRIQSCLLYIVNNDLHATIMSNGQLFVCKSYDMGETFERPVKYKNKFCQSPVKAVFIAPPGFMDESRYYCREMYVDSQNPHDIQILPELYEDFYPISDSKGNGSHEILIMPKERWEKEKADENPVNVNIGTNDNKNTPLPVPDENPSVEKEYVYNSDSIIDSEKDYYDPFANMSFDGFHSEHNPNSAHAHRTKGYIREQNDAHMSYTNIKSQLYNSMRQNAEKDRKISSLMHMLKEKNEEFLKTEQYWKEQLQIVKDNLSMNTEELEPVIQAQSTEENIIADNSEYTDNTDLEPSSELIYDPDQTNNEIQP